MRTSRIRCDRAFARRWNRGAALSALLFFALSASLPPRLLSQNLTGEIDGSVRDASGAVVPNAAVTIKNADQNLVVRTLTTNGQGEFVATLLAIGNYSVTVSAPGFAVTTESVQVHVNQPASASVVLSPGQTSQTVRVTANPVAPQLDNSAAGTLIGGAQITQLSLSSRNFNQLLYIQPGISGGVPGPDDPGLTNSSGAVQAQQFSMNGESTGQVDDFLDGEDIMTHSGQHQPGVYPSVDFIQEMNIERSNFGAQYGGLGSGLVSIQTKSGSTGFHGGAFEFFRSQILNANGYFNNLGKIARPGLRYNEFGYDLGGPIWIPHRTNRDSSKTFFYFGQQLLRSETQTVATLTDIPTAAQRQGVFAVPVCVAANAGGACTQSATTISQIDPTAQAYLKDIIDKTPLPNSPTDPQGLIASEAGFFNGTQTFIRIDHQFNQKFSVFFRYLDDPYQLAAPNDNGPVPAVPGVSNGNITDGGTSYLGHATYVLNSSTVLEGGYAYLSSWVDRVPTGLLVPSKSPDIKPSLPYVSTLDRVPNLIISSTQYVATGPFYNRFPSAQIFLNVTHTAGRHTLDFGFNILRAWDGDRVGTLNAGQFAFSPGALPAGSAATPYERAFANFLLGSVADFQQASVDASNLVHDYLYEGYLQDDFHVTPRLTLNAGVRYSYIEQPTTGALPATGLLKGAPNVPLVNFDARYFNPADAPAIGSTGLICSTAPCPGGVAPNSNYNPLNGLIVGNKTSPYGSKVMSQPVLAFAPRVGFALDVFGDGRTALRGGYGIYYEPPANLFYQSMVTSDPPNVTNTSITNTSFDNPGNGVPTLSSVPLAIYASQTKPANPYVEAWNLDLQQEIARGAIVDIGYYGNSALHQIGYEDINQPLPGEYAQKGIIPGNVVTTANTTYLNQIRPYPGYGPINNFSQIFIGNYQGLQTSIIKRFSDGSLLNANYTWSKSMANGGPQNIYNLAPEYGRAAYNRTNIFSADFVYQLPFFRNQRGFTGHALGGWETTGIISYGSGLPMTASTINVDPGGLGLLAGGGSAPRRPDALFNPNQGAPHSFKEWFNTAAFAQVPKGQYRPGDAPVADITGPGYGNWDLSLFKNFAIEGSTAFQLRAESFNAFNHVNFTSAATTFGLTNFGQLNGAASARILQLAAKITF